MTAIQIEDVLKNPDLLKFGPWETLVINLDGKILYPNHWQGELIDRHLVLSQEVKDAFLKKNPETYQQQKFAWQGTAICGNLKVMPLHQESSHVAWLIAFDLSNRDTEVEQLKTRIADLEKASVAKSEFLANMSHELRSPMTSIIGMSHMLMETELNTEQRECAEVITTSASSLLNLINDTLDISKLDAGKVVLEKIPFNLYGLAEQVCRTFLLKTHKKGLHLTIDYHPDLAQQLIGDPGRLRQILTNLVSNAIKFTSSGGITLSISRGKIDPQKISIAVNDTGIGIPSHALHKIFNKFEQADQSTTRKYGGTGLGLAICKELCELMGGTISIESEVGVGSTFKMELSLKQQDQSEIQLQRAEIEQRRILCVDNNPTILRIMSRNLQNSGLDCETAINATQALNLLEKAQENEEPFDFLMTDFQLPDIDGVSLGRKIKNHPTLNSTHLIMLTSLGKKGDSQLVSEAGFEAYLVKPTANEIILDTLSCVLGNEGNKDQKLITKYTLMEEQAVIRQGSGPTLIKHSDLPSKEARPELPMHVLIAEDDPMIQKVLQKLMKKLNQEFTLVENGQLALEAFQKIKPNLILMDWHMPEMDGLTATQRIREMEQGQRSTWIIGLTAGGADNVKEKCLASGMDNHLQKPFEIEVFKTVFQHGLEMARNLHSQK